MLFLLLLLFWYNFPNHNNLQFTNNKKNIVIKVKRLWKQKHNSSAGTKGWLFSYSMDYLKKKKKLIIISFDIKSIISTEENGSKKKKQQGKLKIIFHLFLICIFFYYSIFSTFFFFLLYKFSIIFFSICVFCHNSIIWT